jgi:hypothetical protein
MIIWKNLSHLSEDLQEKIRLCESCEHLGVNKNCTIHECGCFVTSIVIENKGCPIKKWT